MGLPGGIRAGESGVLLQSLVTSMSPAAITAPNENSVAVTDARFIGAQAVVATFAAAPSAAGLGIKGAWVSNATTGQVTVRFVAVGANYVQAAESILIQRLA